MERWDGDEEGQLFLESNQLPKIGEWTRMEISHKEEDGEFFLSFGVAGRQLARKEATEFREMANVTIRIGTVSASQTTMTTFTTMTTMTIPTTM